MDPRRSRLLLLALLAATTAVWGWTFVVVKQAVSGYPVLSFLTLRFAVAVVAMMPVVWLRRRGRTAPRTIRRNLLVGGGIGAVLGAAFVFQTFGLQRTTPTNCGFVTGLFVVFVPIANRVLFGVRVPAVLWGCVASAVVGMMLITGGLPHRWSAGDLLTLVGAAGLGLHVALLDRCAGGRDPYALAMCQFLGATLLFALCDGGDVLRLPPDAAVWQAVVLCGLLATAGGFTVQTLAQQRLSAVRTAVVLTTEPLFAAAFGAWLLGDRLGPVQYAGAGVLLAALLAAELAPRRNHAGTQAASPDGVAGQPAQPVSPACPSPP